MGATIWLAIVTTILAAVTWLLWSATQALAMDARNTAAQQAADMQASLRIAKESADAANKTANAMIASERAWVGVSRIEMSPPKFSVVGVRECNASITLINHGRTVARLRSNFHGRFHILNEMRELPPAPDYPSPLRMEGAEHTTIFLKPNETLTTTPITLETTKPAPEEVEAISGSRKEVFLYGRVTYFDFAEQERITQFCYTWVPLTETWEVLGPREYNKHT